MTHNRRYVKVPDRHGFRVRIAGGPELVEVWGGNEELSEREVDRLVDYCNDAFAAGDRQGYRRGLDESAAMVKAAAEVNERHERALHEREVRLVAREARVERPEGSMPTRYSVQRSEDGARWFVRDMLTFETVGMVAMPDLAAEWCNSLNDAHREGVVQGHRDVTAESEKLVIACRQAEARVAAERAEGVAEGRRQHAAIRGAGWLKFRCADGASVTGTLYVRREDVLSYHVTDREVIGEIRLRDGSKHVIEHLVVPGELGL